MLWHILDAYDGKLPPDVHVLFANTGKECEESLEFVRDCGLHWGVDIVWLEYAEKEVQDRTHIVDFETASRDGQPFEILIREKNYLPNRVERFCTTVLKINRFEAFMHKQCGYDNWDSLIGYRSDEPLRIVKMRDRNNTELERGFMTAPMNEAKTTKRKIIEWWSKQPFDLKLPDNGAGQTLAGNCDMCFLKGRSIRKRLLNEQPWRGDWWIGWEKTIRPDKSSGARFDREISVEQLRKVAQSGKRIQIISEEDDTSISCFCSD